MSVTQRDITKASLAMETIQDEVAGLRDAYPDFDSMPKAKQNRCVELDKELAQAREAYADLSIEWRAEQRKQGKTVNALPLGSREDASDIYSDDEYGFNKYSRMARGRLQNFSNNREGHKRAELAGAVFYANAQNARPEMREQANKILTSGEHDLRHVVLDKNGSVGEAQTRDLTSAVESLGGVLVPTVLEASIFSLVENYGIAMRECDVRPMGGGKMKFPRRGKAVVGGWTIETLESEFDKNMDFNSFEMDAKDYFVFTSVPNQLVQDSIVSVGDFIMGQMAWRQAYDWDNAWINGAATADNGNISGLVQQFNTTIPGSGAPNPGLVTCASSSSATTWSAITDADLFKLRGTPRLFSNNMSKWKWYCTNQFFNEVMLPRIGTAQFGWEVTFGDGKVNMQVGAQRFMGFEVVIVPGPLMPTAPDGNPNIVCFLGDASLSTSVGIRLGAEFLSTPLAGRAFFNYSTYTRMVQRGDIVNHDAGLTTFDPLNNHIAGPIAALKTFD